MVHSQHAGRTFSAVAATMGLPRPTNQQLPAGALAKCPHPIVSQTRCRALQAVQKRRFREFDRYSSAASPGWPGLLKQHFGRNKCLMRAVVQHRRPCLVTSTRTKDVTQSATNTQYVTCTLAKNWHKAARIAQQVLGCPRISIQAMFTWRLGGRTCSTDCSTVPMMCVRLYTMRRHLCSGRQKDDLGTYRQT